MNIPFSMNAQTNDNHENKLLQMVKNFFDNATEEEKKEVEKYNEIGPDVFDYFNDLQNMINSNNKK